MLARHKARIWTIKIDRFLSAKLAIAEFPLCKLYFSRSKRTYFIKSDQTLLELPNLYWLTTKRMTKVANESV